MIRRLLCTVGPLCLALGIGACATVPLEFDEEISDYRWEVERLHRDIARNPGSGVAHRDLGIIYLRTGSELEASNHLQSAYELGERDPRLIFYLGLAYEMIGLGETALRLYETYPDVPRSSPYRRLMSGRYDVLVRERIGAEMSQLVEVEENLAGTVPSNAVAVYGLRYSGTDESYAPLGRGLAEMLTVDLSVVSQLRVLERGRIEALQDQIELGRLQITTPETSPRSGRFLGAGRIVSGTLSVLSGRELRVDGALLETNSAAVQSLPPQTDELEGFFMLEKRMVYDVLTEMNIELTEAERQQIEAVPTRNLQAFLAYSRGLLSEDAQDFEAAAAFFEQAGSLDPTFTVASARGERALGMSAAMGSPADVLLGAKTIEPVLPGSTWDLVIDRLDHLGEGVSSPLVSTSESRKPGPEGLTTSLPDPPDPPRNGNQ